MELTSKLGRALSESAADIIKLNIKCLWLDTSCWEIFYWTLHQHSLYGKDGVTHPSPSSCLLLSFPKTVYCKHKNNSAWAHYGNSQATKYCQVRPQSLAIALLPWQPSIQEHGAEGWLCAGAGCDVLRGGLHDVIPWHGGGQSNPEKIMSPFV